MPDLRHPERVNADLARIKARAVLKPARTDDMCPDYCTGFYTTEGRNWPCVHSDDLTGMPGHTCPRYLGQQEAHVVEWLRRIGVPERYRNGINEDMLPQREALKNWVDTVLGGRTEVGLVLCGGVGTGKSMALGWLARQLWPVRRTTTVAWVLATDLFDRLHGHPDSVYDWAAIDIMLLDDFGRQFASDWAAPRWDSLVEKRYSSRRPIIMTTNLAPTDMDQETRWFDRLKESCVWLRIRGSSQRSRRAGL